MYTEAHPRPNAARAASSFSSNSFTSYLFRTLASHLKATVSSNPCEIKRFRTLRKIPGIGYPLSPIATDLRPPLPPQSHYRHSTPLCSTTSGLFCAMDARNPFLFNRFWTLSIAMGVYTPLVHPERSPRRASPSSSAYPLFLFPEITQTLEIRPSWKPWFSFFRFHESQVTSLSRAESRGQGPSALRERKINAPAAAGAISCPEPRRGVRINSFLPRPEGRGELPHACPKRDRGVRENMGRRGVVWFLQPEILNILPHCPLPASAPARSFVFGVEGSGRLLWIGGGSR